MIRLLLFIAMLVAVRPQCIYGNQNKGYSLWEVDDLSMEYYKYREQFRDPYFIEQDGHTYKPMSSGAELKMNLSLLKYSYWDNRIHMASDETNVVKHVGWEWEAGLHLPYIDLFSHHHSRHGLEYQNPRGDRFPVEDYFGIRFRFIEKGNK